MECLFPELYIVARNRCPLRYYLILLLLYLLLRKGNHQYTPSSTVDII